MGTRRCCQEGHGGSEITVIHVTAAEMNGGGNLHYNDSPPPPFTTAIIVNIDRYGIVEDKNEEFHYTRMARKSI